MKKKDRYERIAEELLKHKVYCECGSGVSFTYSHKDISSPSV